MQHSYRICVGAACASRINPLAQIPDFVKVVGNLVVHEKFNILLSIIQAKRKKNSYGLNYSNFAYLFHLKFTAMQLLYRLKLKMTICLLKV
jgi:hypothetical protein